MGFSGDRMHVGLKRLGVRVAATNVVAATESARVATGVASNCLNAAAAVPSAGSIAKQGAEPSTDKDLTKAPDVRHACNQAMLAGRNTTTSIGSRHPPRPRALLLLPYARSYVERHLTSQQWEI
jgi:hypothetical protein